MKVNFGLQAEKNEVGSRSNSKNSGSSGGATGSSSGSCYESQRHNVNENSQAAKRLYLRRLLGRDGPTHPRQ